MQSMADGRGGGKHHAGLVLNTLVYTGTLRSGTMWDIVRSVWKLACFEYVNMLWTVVCDFETSVTLCLATQQVSWPNPTLSCVIKGLGGGGPNWENKLEAFSSCFCLKRWSFEHLLKAKCTAPGLKWLNGPAFPLRFLHTASDQEHERWEGLGTRLIVFLVVTVCFRSSHWLDLYGVLCFIG